MPRRYLDASSHGFDLHAWTPSSRSDDLCFAWTCFGAALGQAARRFPLTFLLSQGQKDTRWKFGPTTLEGETEGTMWKVLSGLAQTMLTTQRSSQKVKRHVQRPNWVSYFTLPCGQAIF